MRTPGAVLLGDRLAGPPRQELPVAKGSAAADRLGLRGSRSPRPQEAVPAVYSYHSRPTRGCISWLPRSEAWLPWPACCSRSRPPRPRNAFPRQGSASRRPFGRDDPCPGGRPRLSAHAFPTFHADLPSASDRQARRTPMACPSSRVAGRSSPRRRARDVRWEASAARSLVSAVRREGTWKRARLRWQETRRQPASMLDSIQRSSDVPRSAHRQRARRTPSRPEESQPRGA